jgi:hypothetical protein
MFLKFAKQDIVQRDVAKSVQMVKAFNSAFHQVNVLEGHINPFLRLSDAEG